MDPVVRPEGKWFLFIDKVKKSFFLLLFTWPKAG
jgi:hypothetical protein